MQTVLVTGGTGFLASHCLVELLQRGYRVRTTVRDLSRTPEIRAALASAGVDDTNLTVLAANLDSEEGWGNAASGCDYILHVASPFPRVQPKDHDELIVPAREGTRRVLEAGLDAGVKRIVTTSSIVAIHGGVKHSAAPLTETAWADPDSLDLTPYVRSKTIAERAAWDLVIERGEEEKLAVINPGAILGPLLSDDPSYSLEAIERMLQGTPAVPRIGFSFVDVRDVADIHLRAMTSPAAAGKRFIATQQFLWMSEVAAVLRDQLGRSASKVPKLKAPDIAVRAMGIFDPSVRALTGQLGEKVELSSERAKSVLGWSPRPLEETIVDCARSLIDRDLVKVAR